MSTPVRYVRIVGTCDDALMVAAETDEAAIEIARTLRGRWSAPGVELRIARTQPNHAVLGHTFHGFTESCVCIAYDGRVGYWMRFPDGSQRDVSERTIGRIYHRNDSGEAP